MGEPAMSPIRVVVNRSRRRDWEVAVRDRGARIACETLDDAKRAGSLRRAQAPCEFVVRPISEADQVEGSLRGTTWPTKPRIPVVKAG